MSADVGELLRSEQIVGEDDLHRAREEQQRSGQSLGRVLVGMGLAKEADLVAALAHQLGLEFVDLTGIHVDTVTAASVPESLLRRHVMLPFAVADDGALRVAISDPANVVALDDLRSVTGRAVRPVVGVRSDILAAIDRYARMGDSVEEAADSIGANEEADWRDLAELKEVVDEAPIVKFVNALISQAVADRASDIHIEPGEDALRVRYRVDGVLHEVTSQSRKIHAGVISRLKIMSDLDIAERRLPQDGRMTLKAGGRAVDVRVSCLPTVFGEKVVLRILDKTSILLDLADLGFLDHNYVRYESSFRKPYGMILVTGPTGSGKSTTLYATLNVINRPEINIVTVEDPVEYRLAGVNQVQIHAKAGLTFAGALRSILRQDPDVVLVGEMRDHETAQIGMEAALTGHMVLATLHTNDAPSAVTRLTEMRIDPFLVASAVDCVLAQRLARRLCVCSESYEATPAELLAAGLGWDEADPLPVLRRPVGCLACANTGYRGRLAVHEVMPVTEEIERAIVENASTDHIARLATEQGMTSLRDDGLAKVLLGRTTLEEIARVIA